MAATTQDRNTPRRDGVSIPLKVAAGELIPAGTMVCVNATGFAVSATKAANLIYIGRSDERVDNRTGQDGDAVVLVERGRLFAWENDGTVNQALVGKKVYLADNQTVTATDTGTSPAGKCALIDDCGVWTLA